MVVVMLSPRSSSQTLKLSKYAFTVVLSCLVVSILLTSWSRTNGSLTLLTSSILEEGQTSNNDDNSRKMVNPKKSKNYLKKNNNKKNSHNNPIDDEAERVRIRLVKERRLWIAQQPLEFVHITKTGGTAVEYYGAIYANMTWGVCHWTPSPLLYPACIADHKIPPEMKDSISSYNKLLSLDHFTKYHYLERKQIRKGYEIWHAPPSWLNPKHSPYHHHHSNRVRLSYKPMFAVIRDPYSRMVSEFYCPFRGYDPIAFTDPSYRNPLTGEATKMELQRRRKFKKNEYVYIKPNITVDILNNWIQEKIKDSPLVYTSHFIPQYEYVYDTSQLRHRNDIIIPTNEDELPLQLPVIIKHVIKYENLANEFDALMKLYSLPIPSMSSLQSVNTKEHHEKKSSANKKLTISDLSPETIRLINQIYYYDFKLFNYTMMDP